MTAPTLLRGGPLAAEIRTEARESLADLRASDNEPLLGTVLMSDDDADVAFMDRKHELCAEMGIPTERVDVPPGAPASRLYEAVDRLAADDRVTALFVQAPLPEHVDADEIRTRVPPDKDVDCFAPANLGRLVGGDPRIVPATPAAVLGLLTAHDIETAGRDVVIVGRTAAICRPLANLLLAPGPQGDATVTVCHSRTTDLAAKTRAADVLVTAAGTPRLVDGSMVTRGTVVVDISVNRVPVDTETGYELVGDVAFEQVREKASAITPVPGGVGPLTLACLLRNVVEVTRRGPSR